MNRESGQAIVLVQVALSLLLFGALGLGIDGAQLYVHRQMAQAAADAAAQSAIMSILRGTNSTSTNSFSTAASFTCTVPPSAVDLRTPCVYAQSNGFGTAADAVTVSFPGSINGTTLASVNTPAVTVTVQRVVKTAFVRFLGTSTATIKAKASAGILSTVPPTCVFVLDPAAANTLTVTNGIKVDLGCGVSVDSKNATAASFTGGAKFTATGISIVGGFSQSNGAQVSPAPKAGAAVSADPFASVHAPSVGVCDHNNYSLGWGTWTLNPGVYCNGLNIGNSATATFNPGTYIVNGGQLHFGGGATVTGDGVTFYLTGTNATYGSVSIDNGTSVNLTAPASGTYVGLLFFQDRSITSAVTANFAGGATSQFSGSLYFPTTTISFSNGTKDGGTVALIAAKLSFNNGAKINFDSTGTKTGLAVQAVGLME